MNSENTWLFSGSTTQGRQALRITTSNYLGGLSSRAAEVPRAAWKATSRMISCNL
jgi:hypothetical protein